jgi:hypothetical protein
MLRDARRWLMDRKAGLGRSCWSGRDRLAGCCDAANGSKEPRAAIENVQTRSTLPGNVELLTMNNETKTGSEDDSLLDS